MKRDVSTIIVISLVILAGLSVAGFVQDNGNTALQNGAGLSPGPLDTPPGSARQFRDPGMLTNVTVLATAAAKLGVSGHDVQDARESTKNATSGRPGLNAAAQKLGVTRQNLTDAFGFPASGGRPRGGGTTAPPVPGQ
jgi:hypothetical protein